MDIFKLKENKTNFKTEIIAGLTTFLAMVYIIPVNSSIVSNTGMPIEALITATALITIIASAFNAFFTNTPVAMSVGMGLNAYFTFTVCLRQNIPWQNALGAVFISSIIFFVLSFTRFRLWIIQSIPKDLRLAICAGIGCFIAFLGLSQMGVIAYNKDTLVSIGNFKSPSVLFGIFTLALIIFFWAIKLRGASILWVLASSIVAWIFHLDNASFPTQIFSLPNFDTQKGLGVIFLKLDIQSALEISMIPIILTFFITQLFDSIGIITEVGERGKIFDDPKNDEKKLGKTLMADATGTALGALTGTSTVTAFVGKHHRS